METISGSEGDRPDRDPEVADDEAREMPPEPAPSPGEIDRANLGQDDVSEQAP